MAIVDNYNIVKSGILKSSKKKNTIFCVRAHISIRFRNIDIFLVSYDQILLVTERVNIIPKILGKRKSAP